MVVLYYKIISHRLSTSKAVEEAIDSQPLDKIQSQVRLTYVCIQICVKRMKNVGSLCETILLYIEGEEWTNTDIFQQDMIF